MKETKKEKIKRLVDLKEQHKRTLEILKSYKKDLDVTGLTDEQIEDKYLKYTNHLLKKIHPSNEGPTFPFATVDKKILDKSTATAEDYDENSDIERELIDHLRHNEEDLITTCLDGLTRLVKKVRDLEEKELSKLKKNQGYH